MNLADLITDAEWKKKAACLDMDHRIFFPGSTGPSNKRAKKICRGCVVQAECLEYALGFPVNSDYGIYGGTNSQERRKLRRERRAA